MEVLVVLYFLVGISCAAVVDYNGVLPLGYDVNFVVDKGKYSDPNYASIYVDYNTAQQNTSLYCWSELQNPTAYAKFYLNWKIKPKNNATFAFFGSKIGDDSGRKENIRSGYYFIGMYADCSTCITDLKAKIACRATRNGTVLPPLLVHNRRTQLFDLTTSNRWQYFLLLVGEENLLDGIFQFYMSLGISKLSTSTIVTYYKADDFPTTNVYGGKYPGGTASAGEYSIAPWTLAPGRYYVGIYLVKLGSGVGSTCQASIKAGFNFPPTGGSLRGADVHFSLIFLILLLSLLGTTHWL